jgi:hypothetical protein
MKKGLLLFVFVSGGLLTNMQAATKGGDQTATVVSVENHSNQSDSGNTGSVDSPLQTEVYSYDIGIRVGSTIYRTRYDSTLDYLPAAFAAQQSIHVRLGTHVMYVTLPGDQRARIIIESRG